MKATVLSQLHGQLFLRKKEKKRSCVAHRQPQVTLPELTKIAFPPPRMSGCLLLGYRLADEFIIYDVLCVFFGKTTVLIIQFICRIFHTCWWSQDGFQTVTPQKKNCSTGHRHELDCARVYLFFVALRLLGSCSHQQRAGNMCPRSDGPVHGCWTFSQGPSPLETWSGHWPHCSLLTTHTSEVTGVSDILITQFLQCLYNFELKGNFIFLTHSRSEQLH